jgi:CRP-like cAMP-binding protein
MSADGDGVSFKIWGVDNVVYGPVELPMLVEWVKEERVTSDTWVYSEQADAWHKAPNVPELRMFFRNKPAAAAPGSVLQPHEAAGAPAKLRPGSVRRVKILAEFTDEQLERLIHFMEVQPVRQWAEIVKQGQHGDAMYFVLEGELRVRMMIGGKESILVTLGPGEFFGEISIFDQGARSADVVANVDSVLLKLSAAGFLSLLQKAPELAAPFLFAIARTLAARIRADNKRHHDSINFARTAGK